MRATLLAPMLCIALVYIIIYNDEGPTKVVRPVRFLPDHFFSIDQKCSSHVLSISAFWLDKGTILVTR